MSIDEIDLRILDMLQRNGKLSQARIAGAVGLTTPRDAPLPDHTSAGNWSASFP